jgi:sugar/nucleoside kinase (ribokinase family)
VGWLGLEHRTLRVSSINDRASDIAGSDAILVTLEASEDAVAEAIRYARGKLVVLNASPIVERPYALDTEIIEGATVVVGTLDELAALLHRGRRTDPQRTPTAIATELAELCSVTVVVTNLRSEDRKAVAVSPYGLTAVPVRSPRVLKPNSTDSVGATDAFCAALVLASLRLEQADGGSAGRWHSDDSPLATSQNLREVLMAALSAEAWVSRSAGGYVSFPIAGRAFDDWTRDHPARPE